MCVKVCGLTCPHQYPHRYSVFVDCAADERATPNFISHPFVFSFPHVPDESRSLHSTSLNSYLDCRTRVGGSFFQELIAEILGVLWGC